MGNTMKARRSNPIILINNATKSFGVLLNHVKALQEDTILDSLQKEISEKPAVWSGVILFLILFVIGSLCYLYHLIRGLSMCRKNAYNDLVKSGFFKKWIIRDLEGLIYNPSGIAEHQPEENISYTDDSSERY